MRKLLPDVVGMFAGAMLATVAFGIVAHIVLAALITTPTAVEIARKFDLLPMYLPLVRPEPVEDATFVATLLAALVFLSTAAWASVHRKPDPAERGFWWGAIACALCGGAWWVIVALARPWTFPLAGLVAPSIAHGLDKFAVLVVVFAGLAAGLAMLPTTRLWRLLPGVLASGALAFIASFSILGTHDAYSENTHYEVFVYPLIQDWLGTGVSTDSGGQKSQYGLYPLFLRFVWHFTGAPSTLAVTVVMAVLLLVCFLLLLAFITRFTSHAALAAILALACVTGGLLVFPLWPLDPYFQFFPVRLLFPSIALGLACLAPTRPAHWFLCYLLLAIGLVWNFESGIVGLATFGTFVLAAGTNFRFADVLRAILGQAALATGAIAAVAAGVAIYDQARFGSAPDFLGYVHSLRAFSSGIGAAPMPPFGAWGLHCLVYAVSLFVGLRALWLGTSTEDRRRAAALLAMAVSGVIWFRYYQVRSVPPQLQFASMPALCCGALLVDRWLSAWPARRWAVVAASAVVAAPMAAAICVWYASPESNLRTLESIEYSHAEPGWNRAAAAAVATFEKVKRDGRDEMLVLAPYAHLVNLQRGKPGPIHAAGVCQLWFEPELDEVMRVASSDRTVLVVVDASSSCAPLQGAPPGGAHGLEPRLAALLQQEFVLLGGRDVEGIDCGDRSKLYVRKGVATDRLGTRPHGANVAEGKDASQSTSLAANRPSLAVDGNVDGTFVLGSTTHTQLERAPWWEVDLGAETDIAAVEIWNRTDCCGERLRDFWVLASNERLPTGLSGALLAKRPGVHGTFQSGACRLNTIRAGFKARFVRVQLDGDGYLSLAEVRVLARDPMLKREPAK